MSIKEKIVNYRNTHKESRTLLGVIIGEFERIEKSPNRTIKEISDSEAINIIKKMIESNCLVNSLECLYENEILKQFIPSQLTETQIQGIIDECNFSSIKECMTFFKENHTGLYDGKIVSKIFNSK